MTRAVTLALMLVVVGACARTYDNEQRLRSTFDASKAAVRRGELDEARTLADRGLSLAQPDTEWAWTFRLFGGEILLLQHQQPSEALPLVNAAVPSGTAFDGVRARQKYLEARLLLT